MKFSTSVVAVAGLATQVSAKDIEIQVGMGGLKFSPNSITAAVGDELVFTFYPANHSVAAGFVLPWTMFSKPPALTRASQGLQQRLHTGQVGRLLFWFRADPGGDPTGKSIRPSIPTGSETKVPQDQAVPCQGRVHRSHRLLLHTTEQQPLQVGHVRCRQPVRAKHTPGLRRTREGRLVEHITATRSLRRQPRRGW